MAAVEYFDMEGAPGKYFACSRYGTMSVASCGKNYAAAPLASKTGRLEACVGCPVGLAHSGSLLTSLVPSVAPPVPESGLYCVRCRRSGRDQDSRLVGRMRLVRGHSICVSCFNREREVLKGANAKGAKPKKWKHLFYARIGLVSDKGFRVEQLSHPVHDVFEAMLTVNRRPAADRPQFLCWTGGVIQREEE
jgi:hypothetical protein